MITEERIVFVTPRLLITITHRGRVVVQKDTTQVVANDFCLETGVRFLLADGFSCVCNDV